MMEQAKTNAESEGASTARPLLVDLKREMDLVELNTDVVEHDDDDDDEVRNMFILFSASPSQNIHGRPPPLEFQKLPMPANLKNLKIYHAKYLL